MFKKIKGSYLYGKATAEFLKANYNEAITFFEKSVTLDPTLKNKNPMYYSQLGRCYAKMKNKPKAIQMLKIAKDLFNIRNDLSDVEKMELSKCNEILEIVSFNHDSDGFGSDQNIV